jgi:hypothetical protein
MSLALYLIGFFVIFSYVIYAAGLVGLIAGLILLGHLAHIPAQWISATVVALIGAAAVTGVKRGRC